MDSDSDTFSDAREDLFDTSAECLINKGLQRDPSNTRQPRSDLPGVEPEDFQPAVSDDSECEASTSAKPDPDAARKKSEALLDSEELEKRRVAAQEIKEEGNKLFKEAKYSDALKSYTEALDLCPLTFTIDRSVMFSNRAACHSKLDAPESALTDCDAALALQPNYLKCLLRRATIREEKDRLSEALEDYQTILKLDPGNEKARWACMTLPDRIKEQQEKMKEQMLDQLKQLGNMVLKPFGLSTENFKVQKNPDSEGYSINFVR